MKFSTKTRYGTRALLDLAIHQKGNTPVPLKDIAGRQSISLNYLEHIITHLITANIIGSTRGIKGGVYLTRSAKHINLKEVVELLEGQTNPVECLVGVKTCPRSSLCATQDLWHAVGSAIDKVLQNTTLQDLADKQKIKNKSENMYYI
jgi:Rrf2 family transcriptional regulator, cysteine metabolism repressor